MSSKQGSQVRPCDYVVADSGLVDLVGVDGVESLLLLVSSDFVYSLHSGK